MALQFWKGPYGGSNQLFMKNGYDHHDHQDIYTYNLSVPERFTLDVPNQSPPTSMQKAGGPQIYSGLMCTRGDRAKGPENLTFLYYICIWMFVFEEWIGRVGWVKYDKTDFPLVPVFPIIQHYELCSSNKVFSLSDIQSLPPFLCHVFYPNIILLSFPDLKMSSSRTQQNPWLVDGRRNLKQVS